MEEDFEYTNAEFASDLAKVALQSVVLSLATTAGMVGGLLVVGAIAKKVADYKNAKPSKTNEN